MIDPTTKDIIIFLIALTLSAGLIYIMLAVRSDNRKLKRAINDANQILRDIDGHYVAVENIKWLYDAGHADEGNAMRLLLVELENIYRQKRNLYDALNEVEKYDY